MPIDCSPDILAQAAACYCYDAVTTEKVKVYLLAVIAGLDTLPPATLAESASCYCFDPLTLKRIQAWILCDIDQIIGEGGGG